MPPRWDELTQDPFFKTLVREDRQDDIDDVKERYYLNVIKKEPQYQSFDREQRKEVHRRFFEEAEPVVERQLELKAPTERVVFPVEKWSAKRISPNYAFIRDHFIETDPISRKYNMTSKDADKIMEDIGKEGISNDQMRMLEFKIAHSLERTPKERLVELFKANEEWDNKVELPLNRMVNSFMFGLPEWAARDMGYEMEQPETGGEAVLAGAGELAGFILGPLGVAGKVTKKIPGIARLFTPGGTKPIVAVKTMLRSGATLGTASVLRNAMKPDEYVSSFGSGAIFGTGMGALHFLPSTPLRMITSSAVMGVPSTLREEPLEEQIFSWGLGMMYGRKGVNFKKQFKTEQNAYKILKDGLPRKVATPIMEQTDQMLRDLQRDVRRTGAEPMTKDQRFYNTMKRVGKYGYTPPYEEKAWRKRTSDFVWKNLKRVKSQRGFELREDELPEIVDYFKNKQGNLVKGKISKLDNGDLNNLSEFLNSHVTGEVKKDFFKNRPPFKRTSVPLSQRGLLRGKTINAWDIILRPGYKLLNKLGFGYIQDGGLTEEYFGNDVTQAQFLNRHRQIVNNWQKTIGFSRTKSRDVFRYLDGKVHERYLQKTYGEKTVKSAKQMRSYLDSLLELQNRYRAQYGEEPVKPKENYITHIFDGMKKDAIQRRHPFPEHLESIMKWITPKEKRSPYLLRRRGVQGYVQDVWKALDAYGNTVSGVVADSGVRRSEKLIRFIDREMKLEDAYKKTHPEKKFPIDWAGIRKNVRSYADSYVGRPGKWSAPIRNTLEGINHYLPEPLQIKSLSGMTNTFNSLIYGASMGYRPKLAIRNLGQHSLIFGEVGTKPLLKAIKTKPSRQTDAILSHSKVLDTRKLHFAPEIQPAFSGRFKSKLSKSAFFMFRGADRINVRDAFLAGYYEAKGKGLSDGDAYKRGDMVAAKTQYLYLKGNRSGLARGLGKSPELGRTAAIFTTWPTNWLELQLSWAKPEHKGKLLRYLGLNVGMMAVAAGTGINVWNYTGIRSPGSLLRLMKGVPIMGIADRPPIPPLIIQDIQKSIKEDDIRELMFYTFGENESMWPLWYAKKSEWEKKLTE